MVKLCPLQNKEECNVTCAWYDDKFKCCAVFMQATQLSYIDGTLDAIVTGITAMESAIAGIDDALNKDK